LGPELKKSGLDTELWLGTINGPFSDFMMKGFSSPFEEFYDQFANTILSDEKARGYLTGVGVQWGGKHILEQVEISYPEIKIMQTECECGDGENTWEHAEYVFRLMWHYIYHRAESFVYWNMVLQQGGISTWGWKQNSLITIDDKSLKVTYNPEFYAMKHLSSFVKKGAKVLKTKGHWTANSIAFENPDGTIIILVGSNMNHAREFSFLHGEKSFTATIQPHSINTFIID
jgi:glucosylceramidase